MGNVYTRFQTKSPKIYTLWGGTYIYGLFNGVPHRKQPFPEVRLAENEHPSATWKTSTKNLKEYKHNFKVINEWMNEWMKSRGWEDNRRALLQYILTCEQ